MQSIALGKFFSMVMGAEKGWIAIATSSAAGVFEKDEYFKWPSQRDNMLEYINKVTPGHNVYFCPNLLDKPKRNKDSVVSCQCVWADLDTCDPDTVNPKPPIVVRTSVGRYHAFWPTEKAMPPHIAEDYARRLAYHYSSNGADKSGWDLGQLLRVPGTFNYKYSTVDGEPPTINIVRANAAKVPEVLFTEFPEIIGSSFTVLPFPDKLPSLDEVLSKYEKRRSDKFYRLYGVAPSATSDWSALLWELELMCFEMGMAREEVFVICNAAACNKFDRDGRPEIYLWHDVLRAQRAHETGAYFAPKEIIGAPSLVDDDEPFTEDNFVAEYTTWAAKQTDAPVEYHEASAFMILSALLSGTVFLRTSYGKIMPNLWVMFVADTTLTRKTTAMDMAIDILEDVYPNTVMATDGTFEGMFRAISARDGLPSIFLRDEFTGLIDSVKGKNYMAGMLEAITKLYDGRPLSRPLAKETISVQRPVFLLFAGSIRKKLYSILDESHVLSGFLPRFIFITAESNIEDSKPLGPPKTEDIEDRAKLVEWLNDLKDEYVTERPHIEGSLILDKPQIEIKLTPEAWTRYNQAETLMLRAGHESSEPEIFTPLLDRMSKTLLKLAMLICCSRNSVEVTPEDIVAAARYIEKWVVHTINIAESVGHGPIEGLLDRAWKFIVRDPGIPRGTIMRSMHLTAQQMNMIEDTLQKRGLIDVVHKGKGVTLWPMK